MTEKLTNVEVRIKCGELQWELTNSMGPVYNDSDVTKTTHFDDFTNWKLDAWNTGDVI